MSDCIDHADNCCHEWCLDCQRGERNRVAARRNEVSSTLFNRHIRIEAANKGRLERLRAVVRVVRDEIARNKAVRGSTLPISVCKRWQRELDVLKPGDLDD